MLAVRQAVRGTPDEALALARLDTAVAELEPGEVRAAFETVAAELRAAHADTASRIAVVDSTVVPMRRGPRWDDP